MSWIIFLTAFITSLIWALLWALVSAERNRNEFEKTRKLLEGKDK